MSWDWRWDIDYSDPAERDAARKSAIADAAEDGIPADHVNVAGPC